MNLLLTALLAFATLGTTAIAADCTDLAGQGHVCATADPASGNFDVEVVIAPQPPIAAAIEPTCQDLAGQGFVCAEVDTSNGVDVDVVAVIEPTPPAASLAANAPTCQDLAGQGSACYEVTADPASGTFDADVVVTIG